MYWCRGWVWESESFPGFESQLCPSQAVGPGASGLNFLSFCFFICKVGASQCGMGMKGGCGGVL